MAVRGFSLLVNRGIIVSMANVLFLVAQDGFQTKEYHDPKRVLAAAGHRVTTASNEAEDAISNMGERIPVEVALRDARGDSYDAVVVVGGPGAPKYLDNPETVRIVREAEAAGKLHGAICIAPRILAKGGLLEGKRATGWDGDGELAGIFAAHDVAYEHAPVVVDGKTITADGPMSAERFGEAIRDALSGV